MSVFDQCLFHLSVAKKLALPRNKLVVTAFEQKTKRTSKKTNGKRTSTIFIQLPKNICVCQGTFVVIDKDTLTLNCTVLTLTIVAINAKCTVSVKVSNHI